MKTFGFAVGSLFMIFILILGIAISAHAGDYLGEICFNIVSNDEPHGVCKFGVTHMGGNYYILQGGPIETNEWGPCFIGSAQVVGNQIIISLHATHSDSPGSMRDTMSCQAILNATTLNGTLWCISTEYLTPYDQFTHSYSEQIFTYTPCP